MWFIYMYKKGLKLLFEVELGLWLALILVDQVVQGAAFDIGDILESAFNVG